MKIKPLTIVCASEAAAEQLAGEYYWIGREALVEGRCVRVLTTTVDWLEG